MIEDVTNESVSTTLTTSNTGNARWLAPELIDSTDNELAVTSPTKKTDVYSYGMSMLELITEKRPWSECKREVMVILNVISKKTIPSRPKDVALSDELWALMQDCWRRDSATRPDMEQVRERLEILQH